MNVEALCLIIQIINWDVEWYRRQYWSQVYTTTVLQLDWVPLVVTLLSLVIQPVFSSPHCALIHLMLHFLYEYLMWESVKDLTEVQIDNILGSPLIYKVSHFIVEDYRFCQARLPLCESMLIHMTIFLSITYLEIVSRLFTLPPFQGSRWGRRICSSLAFSVVPFLPFSREEWHLLSSSSQTCLPSAPFKHNWEFKLYVGDSHQNHFDNIILISWEKKWGSTVTVFPTLLSKICSWLSNFGWESKHEKSRALA